MISIMIDSLMGLQMTVVHNIVDLISLYPKDIPVVALYFFVTTFPESFKDAVAESRLEFNLTEMSLIMVFLDVFSKVFRHYILVMKFK